MPFPVPVFHSHDIRHPDDEYGVQDACWDLFHRHTLLSDIDCDFDEDDFEDRLIDAICKTWDTLYNRNSEMARTALLQHSLNFMSDVLSLRKPSLATTPELLRRFLVRGCDPNGLYLNGWNPSDTSPVKSSWKIALASCGYRLVTMVYGRHVIWLAVGMDTSDSRSSTDEEGYVDVKTDEQFLDEKLPVTGLSVREWIERRFIYRTRKLLLGNLSLWPVRAEELEMLQGVDFEIVLEGAFSTKSLFKKFLYGKFLEEGSERS